MDFNLTEEQILIRDMVREFAEKEVKPIAAEIDGCEMKQRWAAAVILATTRADVNGLVRRLLDVRKCLHHGHVERPQPARHPWQALAPRVD